MNRKFSERWQNGAALSYVQYLIEAPKLGHPVRDFISPLGLTEAGKQDFRGLTLPRNIRCTNYRFENADLSHAVLEHVTTSGWVISGCDFEGASLRETIPWGSTFVACNFTRASFHGGGLGFKGGRYEHCVFDRANFTNALFDRPEFDDCEFRNCKLNACDFNAASFEDCRFSGLVENVWFRGTYGPFSATSGPARPNLMRNVSFENADLRDLTFSEWCDLSTITLPRQGRYTLVPDLTAKMTALDEAAVAWPTTIIKEIDAFREIFRRQAERQDWYLFRHDDLSRYCSKAAQERVWEVLST